MRWARSQELSRAVRMAPWCHSSQGHQEPETHTQVLACGERIRSSPVPPRSPPKPTKLPGKARKKQMLRGSPEGRLGFCRLHPDSPVSWAQGRVRGRCRNRQGTRLLPLEPVCVAHGTAPRRGATRFPGRLRTIPTTTPGWPSEISFGNRGRREVLISQDFCESKGEWGVPSVVS